MKIVNIEEITETVRIVKDNQMTAGVLQDMMKTETSEVAVTTMTKETRAQTGMINSMKTVIDARNRWIIILSN